MSLKFSTMTSCLALTEESFLDLTTTSATHVVFAPGRVNLIGEHTDYNGGFVLPMAIDRGIFIAGRLREDGQVRLWTVPGEAAPVVLDATQPMAKGEPAWSNYVRGVLAGIQQEGLACPGFDAVITSNLPSGGGLSSSAALEIATATLVEALTGHTLDPVRKALLCQQAEHEFAGTPCGIMDQFAVNFGREGNLLLIDCQSQTFQHVPMKTGEVSLLVINSMVKHALNDGAYRQRREDCHAAARMLGVKELRDVTTAQVEAAKAQLPERLYLRARHVTTENARTLAAVKALGDGAWSELGKGMFASHASLRDDFAVSCEELDLIVETARALKVHGCRMTGGGFGGCCVALVPGDRAEEVATGLAASYHAATGLKPDIFATVPSAGPQIFTPTQS